MMLNRFFKTLAFSTSIVLLFSEMINAASPFKIVGSTEIQDANKPICYVKLTGSAIKDLTRICGFIKPQACSGTLGSDSRDRVLNEFCQQNEKCLLTNTCNAQPIAPYGPRPGEAAG